MVRQAVAFVCAAVLVAVPGVSCQLQQPVQAWRVQSSEVATAPGSAISQANYDDASWYWLNSTMGTVLGTLVGNGVYTNPFYGQNLNSINGTLFEAPWWYRGSFPVPAGAGDVLLTLRGQNYRSNVWVNGVQVGNASSVQGAFRYFDFVLTGLVTPGSTATVAVEVFRAYDNVFPPSNNNTDLSITFIDWAPPPADGNLGLWRDALVTTTPCGVVTRYPVVATSLSTDGNTTTAHLSVSVELTNLRDQAVSGTLAVALSLQTISLTTSVTLPPGATVTVTWDNTTVAALNVVNPGLWWPAQMLLPSTTPPQLYNITAWFKGADGTTTAPTTWRFGVREITSIIDSNGHRLYRVNGKNILIRGGGWASDLFFRTSEQRWRDEFQYMMHMGLNTVRLEGQLQDDLFFDIADEMGVLVLLGWSCCDAFQHWPAWTNDTFTTAVESLRSQTRRLRVHPSVLVFLYGSDENPVQDVEKAYLVVFQETLWPNPILASAADDMSFYLGPTGVKMSGPYAWTSPYYWLEGADLNQLGGAFGFLTEASPGSSPLTFESLSWTIPQEYLWPINSWWDFHCANPEGLFRDLRFFTPELYARFGTPTSAQSYLAMAQAQVYEAHRAMFEGYSRNKYESTGIIQWMLNNAWPEMVWHLYDWYLNVGGAYFGVRKATEPLHLVFSYDDFSVWCVNSLYAPAGPMYAELSSVDFWGNGMAYMHGVDFNITGDGSMMVLSGLGVNDLCYSPNKCNPFFIRLTLRDAATDALVSSNDYWLSTTPDVMNWNASNFYRTPLSSYTDYTELCNLPPVNVTTSWTAGCSGPGPAPGSQCITVNVTNSALQGQARVGVAFFVRLRLRSSTASADDLDVLPVLWDDNYLTLFPLESRLVPVSFQTSSLNGGSVQVVTEVYNSIVTCQPQSQLSMSTAS